MQNLQTCPKNIEKRAAILYCNGFGFQSPSEFMKDTFVLVSISDDNIDIKKVKELSGSITVNIIYYLGRCYITINWSEYNKRFHIINTVLNICSNIQLTISNGIQIHSYINENLIERCIINEYNNIKKI